MRKGYSHALTVALQTDPTNPHPVARLGRQCVTRDLPVSHVANALGVSRQTVYNWFWGRHAPSDAQTQAILDLLRQLPDTTSQAVPA